MDPDDFLKDGADGAVPLDPNDPENLVKLTESEDPPIAPPDDVDNGIEAHQQQDVNQIVHEEYDEGTEGAAEVSDPMRNEPPEDYKPSDPAAEGFDADGTEQARADPKT